MICKGQSPLDKLVTSLKKLGHQLGSIFTLWDPTNRSPITTTIRTLRLFHVINRADKECHVDGLMTKMQPMHPGRMRHGFADLVHETARRLQDPMHCTRHFLTHHCFFFGSMETDDTLRFIGEIGRVLRRTHCHNHLGITQTSVIAITSS